MDSGREGNFLVHVSFPDLLVIEKFRCRIPVGCTNKEATRRLRKKWKKVFQALQIGVGLNSDDKLRRTHSQEKSTSKKKDKKSKERPESQEFEFKDSKLFRRRSRDLSHRKSVAEDDLKKQDTAEKRRSRTLTEVRRRSTDLGEIKKADRDRLRIFVPSSGRWLQPDDEECALLPGQLVRLQDFNNALAPPPHLRITAGGRELLLDWARFGPEPCTTVVAHLLANYPALRALKECCGLFLPDGTPMQAGRALASYHPHASEAFELRDSVSITVQALVGEAVFLVCLAHHVQTTVQALYDYTASALAREGFPLPADQLFRLFYPTPRNRVGVELDHSRTILSYRLPPGSVVELKHKSKDLLASNDSGESLPPDSAFVTISCPALGLRSTVLASSNSMVAQVYRSFVEKHLGTLGAEPNRFALHSAKSEPLDGRQILALIFPAGRGPQDTILRRSALLLLARLDGVEYHQSYAPRGPKPKLSGSHDMMPPPDGSLALSTGVDDMDEAMRAELAALQESGRSKGLDVGIDSGLDDEMMLVLTELKQANPNNPAEPEPEPDLDPEMLEALASLQRSRAVKKSSQFLAPAPGALEASIEES